MAHKYIIKITVVLNFLSFSKKHKRIYHCFALPCVFTLRHSVQPNIKKSSTIFLDNTTRLIKSYKYQDNHAQITPYKMNNLVNNQTSIFN